MAGGVSLKWHGTTIAVSTGFLAPTKTITAITKTDPPVVTSVAHGLADGDVVKITGVVGMEEVNEELFVVLDALTDSFTLGDVKASGYGAYVSGGVAAEAEFSNYCQLTGYNRQGGSSPEQDVSTICSTSAEFVLGLPDFGTTQMDFLFSLQDAVQAAIQAADLSKAPVAVRVVLPKNNGTMIQLGMVQQTSEQAANAGNWAGSATIRNSGPRIDVL